MTYPGGGVSAPYGVWDTVGVNSLYPGSWTNSGPYMPYGGNHDLDVFGVYYAPVLIRTTTAASDTYEWMSDGYGETLTYTLSRSVDESTLFGEMEPLNYPSSWSGGGASAYSSMGSYHNAATGQKIKYRFEVTPPTETNVTYKVTWDIVTTNRYDGSSTWTTSVESNLVEFVQGTGDRVNPIYTPEHEIPIPPLYYTATGGGSITKCVANVRFEVVNGSPAGGGPGDGPGCAQCGGGAGHDGGMQAEFGLGYAFSAQPAGTLRIWAATPTASLATPDGLALVANQNFLTVITNGTQLRQVLSPQALADIVVSNAYSYNINFYYSTNVIGITNGLYQATNNPFVSWNILNPNESGSTNTIQITETRGSAFWIYTYIYDPASNSWAYVSPGGVRQKKLITTVNPDGTRTLQSIVGPTNGAATTIFTRTYKTFPWGEGVVQEVVGSGASAQVTTTTYNTNYVGSGAFLPILSVVHPDGSWEYHNNYTTLADGTCVEADVYRSFKDVSLANYTSGRETLYSYTTLGSDDGTQCPALPRTVIEKISGTEVSRSYLIFLPGERDDIQCVRPGAPWNESSNLVTITKYYTNGVNLSRVQSVKNPDGTMSFYGYPTGTNGWQTNTVSVGQPDGSQTTIVDGTLTTTILDNFGQQVSVTVQDIASSILLQQDVYGNCDALDRAQQVTHLDGTTNFFSYACCYLDSTVDRDGVQTTYLYDAAKRQYGYAQYFGGGNPITYSNVLDAAGQVLQSIRIGTDNSAILTSQSAYDLAGELIVQTNTLNGITSYFRTNDSITGGEIRATVNPDGGTITNFYYLDHSLKRMAGSAVHGKAYGYGSGNDVNGVTCTYMVETNLNSDGSLSLEWTKTFTGMARGITETLYADGHYSQSFYNTNGQLSKQIDLDGVITLYKYNPTGERAYTAVDINQNGQIDFNGSDRITWTTNDVTTDHSTNVRRTQTFAWQTPGLDSATLISTLETSADGLQNWQTQYRDASTPVTTHSQSVYSGPNRTVSVTAPDGSYSVSSYSYGRLGSIMCYDSTGTQLGSTTIQYDPHGRQYQVTDVRNGVTIYGYNNGDLVSSVTTPSPGVGISPEITSSSYDSNMRLTNIVQPDGTGVTNEYFQTGELKSTYGTRTYPVAYTYDYAGRMKTMQTWQNFAGNSGTATTTWSYDGQRGFLTNKTYDGGAMGPGYSYTPAGRLATRVWARGITTTYRYDNSGGLTNIAYNDGVTSGVTNTYDRLGRVIQVGASNQVCQYQYDLAGELLVETNTAGVLAGLAVTNGYDAYMRRTDLAALGSGVLSHATYGYDNASRLSTVSDGTNNATYSYLANSPLVSQITFKSNSFTAMTTSKVYDYLSRLTQISNAPSASTAVVFNYTYNSTDQRTQDTLADGSYWVYQYDSLGQVTSGKKYWRDGTPVAGQQFEYGFDDIGNRKQTKVGGDETGANLRVANYTNNSLNQIMSRDVPGYVDVAGIALATNTVTVNGQSAYRKWEYFRDELSINNSSLAVWTNITVASPGQTSIVGNKYIAKMAEIFSYDADGNLTNDGRWLYTWDAENRLIKMQVNTNVGPQYQLTFAYDVKDRRIQKLVSTNNMPIYTNRFLYDGWNLVGELNPASGLTRSYVWGTDLSGSARGAGGIGGLLEVGSATTNCFVAFDSNGNSAALINANNGTIGGTYQYGPFGEVLGATGPMAKADSFRFSTKYQDDESDLLYYGHRYYNQSAGRWLSRDPSGESHGNDLYGFVKNNPVDLFDLLGLECKCCCVEELQIQNITKYSEGDDYGHKFDVHIKLSLHGGAKNDTCSLAWWEKSNRMYVGPPAVNDKWNKMSDILKGQTKALEPWESRKPNEIEFTLHDPPEANIYLPTRILMFDIIMESTKDGDCKHKKLAATATQTIGGSGKLTVQDFKLGLPPGEPK